MDIAGRKLRFIQKYLQVTDEKIIAQLEAILKTAKTEKIQKISVHDFVGILSEEEAEKMKRDIEEACENIDSILYYGQPV